VAYGKSTPTAYTDPDVGRIHQVLDHFQVAIRPGAHTIHVSKLPDVIGEEEALDEGWDRINDEVE